MEKISHIRALYGFIYVSKADGIEILETALPRDTTLPVPLVRPRTGRVRANAEEDFADEGGVRRQRHVLWGASSKYFAVTFVTTCFAGR